MLSAPWVVGPITPCSRYVRVEGLLPRATVILYKEGTIKIATAAAQLPAELIKLDAGIQPEPGGSSPRLKKRMATSANTHRSPIRCSRRRVWTRSSRCSSCLHRSNAAHAFRWEASSPARR